MEETADRDANNPEPKMARRRVEIVNTYGLHMRPSTRFVTLAKSFRAEIWVIFEDRRVNAKSILDMTTLAAPCGALIDLEALGEDAEAALDALDALVVAGFHMAEEET